MTNNRKQQKLARMWEHEEMRLQSMSEGALKNRLQRMTRPDKVQMFMSVADHYGEWELSNLALSRLKVICAHLKGMDVKTLTPTDASYALVLAAEFEAEAKERKHNNMVAVRSTPHCPHCGERILNDTCGKSVFRA